MSSSTLDDERINSYEVTLIVSDGELADTETFTVAVLPVSALNCNINKDNAIFPNPTREEFYIDDFENENYVSAYNSTGIVVFSQHMNGKSYVDLKDIPNGL